MRRRTIRLGRWKVAVQIQASWTYWNIGLSGGMHSWRSFHPWLGASIWVGPIGLNVDATRPDA